MTTLKNLPKNIIIYILQFLNHNILFLFYEMFLYKFIKKLCLILFEYVNYKYCNQNLLLFYVLLNYERLFSLFVFKYFSLKNKITR